jgi:hypothetical protein
VADDPGVAVGELDGEGGVGNQYGAGLVLVDAAEGDLLPHDHDHAGVAGPALDPDRLSWWAGWRPGLGHQEASPVAGPSLVDGLASGRRRWSIRRRPIAGPGLVDGLAVSLLGLDVRAAGVVVCHVQVLDHLRADL